MKTGALLLGCCILHFKSNVKCLENLLQVTFIMVTVTCTRAVGLVYLYLVICNNALYSCFICLVDGFVIYRYCVCDPNITYVSWCVGFFPCCCVYPFWLFRARFRRGGEGRACVLLTGVHLLQRTEPGSRVSIFVSFMCKLY
jgi:hypothetical protein